MLESPEARTWTTAAYTRLRDEERRKSAGARASAARVVSARDGRPRLVAGIQRRGPCLHPRGSAAAGLWDAGCVLHARVEERAERFEALESSTCVGGRGSRATGTRSRRPSPPPGLSLEGHPYAVDLDVFGRASLFQWIGPGATRYGHRALASWFLSPASAPEIVSRQRLRRALRWMTGASSSPRLACWRRRTGPTRSLRSGDGPRALTRHCAGSRSSRLRSTQSSLHCGSSAGLHFSGVMPTASGAFPCSPASRCRSPPPTR